MIDYKVAAAVKLFVHIHTRQTILFIVCALAFIVTHEREFFWIPNYYHTYSHSLTHALTHSRDSSPYSYLFTPFSIHPFEFGWLLFEFERRGMPST